MTNGRWKNQKRNDSGKEESKSIKKTSKEKKGTRVDHRSSWIWQSHSIFPFIDGECVFGGLEKWTHGQMNLSLFSLVSMELETRSVFSLAICHHNRWSWGAVKISVVSTRPISGCARDINSLFREKSGEFFTFILTFYWVEKIMPRMQRKRNG